MFCTNCGTKFEGNFCPKCGQPANAEHMASAQVQSHDYYDKEGDLIDLATIYGVYKDRSGMAGFFRKCTDYDSETIGKALDYIESNITPKEYSMIDTMKMKRQIEAPIEKLDKRRTQNDPTFKVHLAQLAELQKAPKTAFPIPNPFLFADREVEPQRGQRACASISFFCILFAFCNSAS